VARNRATTIDSAIQLKAGGCLAQEGTAVTGEQKPGAGYWNKATSPRGRSAARVAFSASPPVRGLHCLLFKTSCQFRVEICSRLTSRGFTLIELLVVVGMIATLASLLLPGLARTKQQTRSTRCLSNLRQLQIAGQLYADNNEDALLPNYSRNIELIQQSVAPAWVLGNAKEDRSSTNIESGLLYPEIGNAEVYRCPADKSSGPPPRSLRTRSYALSGWAAMTDVEGKGEKFSGDPRKMTDLTSQPLSEIFAFIDEHPDSIDDGVFAVLPRRALKKEWKELPGDRHTGRGCNLSFLDSHVEPWHWKAPKLFRDYDQRPANALDKEDLMRLQDHINNHK
jgi:prepilin-type N-terminal cleavage/methylation domain-containing protein/prepilin-type processing-associated H-X9-DG protein